MFRLIVYLFGMVPSGFGFDLHARCLAVVVKWGNRVETSGEEDGEDNSPVDLFRLICGGATESCSPE